MENDHPAKPCGLKTPLASVTRWATEQLGWAAPTFWPGLSMSSSKTCSLEEKAGLRWEQKGWLPLICPLCLFTAISVHQGDVNRLRPP